MLLEEKVILVNKRDEPLGLAEKMEAHRRGLLHRAFSIFLFNANGEMLLQQRATEKYHAGGLWTNACCSHPRQGESNLEAAQRRLMEELGIQVPLQKIFDFTYQAEVGNGLTEHEFDHVFAGTCEGPIPYNPQEVMDVQFLSVAAIQNWLDQEPQAFTPWFRIAWPMLLNWYSTAGLV